MRIPFMVKFPSIVSASRSLISSASCSSSALRCAGGSLGTADWLTSGARQLDQGRRVEVLDHARQRAVAGLRALEDARERVVVALADRVELVVVAAAQATVKPRNAWEVTSICSSARSSTNCWRFCVLCVLLPSARKPVAIA